MSLARLLIYGLLALALSLILPEQIAAQAGPRDSMSLLLHYINRARSLGSTFVAVDSIYFYNTQASQLAHQLNEDSLLYEARDQASYWYRNRDQQEKSQSLALQNLAYARAVKDQRLLMRSYFKVANYFDQYSGHYNSDSLLYYIDEALEIAQKRNDPLHIIVAIWRIIEDHLYQNRKLEDIPSLVTMALEYEKVDYETERMCRMLHVQLGQYYLIKRQYDQAIQKFHPLSTVEANDGDIGFTIHVLNFLSRAYAESGRHALAYEQELQLNALYQELFDQEKESITQEMEYTFETTKKETAIARLEKDKLLKEKETARLRRNLFLLIFGLAALGVALALAVFNYKRRRRADQELLTLQSELAESKSRMITNVTHEFRTPLTVIKGMTNRIAGHEREKQMINRNNEQLLDLVDQMLTLGKAEAGLLQLELRQGDIIKYARFISEAFHVLFDEKSVSFNIDANPATIIMDYDPKNVRYILANLFSNALKFTPKGGRIELLLNEQNDELFLEVKDTGSGMSESEMAQIFDRFYQTKTSQASFIGTGIGLSLVKELVEHQNGNIHVESNPNEGTSMKIKLPITRHAPSTQFIEPTVVAPPKVDAEESSQHSDATNENIILVVEDNADVMEYVCSSLQNSYQVIRANNGKEGLKLAIDAIPDVIVSDVMMPIMDGYEMLKKLKSNPLTDHIPVVMLTAKTADSSKIIGLSSGADVYMTKPFDEQVLLIQVNNLIHQRDKLKEKFGATEVVEKYVIENSPFLSELERILESNFEDSHLSIESICGQLHISRMQAHRKLKALTGLSMSKYVNEFRLNKSLEFLKDQKNNISDVAYQVGYSDPGYFTKLFSEKYNLSPSAFRQKSR